MSVHSPRGKALLFLGVAIGLASLLADVSYVSAFAGTSLGHAGHGETTPAIHSPFALGLALSGLGVVMTGFLVSQREKLKSVRVLSFLAGLTLLYADGLLHWFAVSEHLTEPLSAIFFVFTGAIQVGAVPFLRQRDRLLWWVGVPLTIFFLELYIITRIVPPPFSVEPESVESLGTLSKAVELGLLAALGIYFGRSLVPTRLKSALTNVRPLAILLLGTALSLVVVNLELEWYWWIFPARMFLLTSIIMIALVAHATLAHYLRTSFLVAMTWSLVMMLLILHGIYALDYARYDLFFPLGLCLVTGTLLAASVLSFRDLRVHKLSGCAVHP